MITWTKIDIGDGEAIWYSDCLEYQIVFWHSYEKDSNLFYHEVIIGDSETTEWDLFHDFESAKQWCEEHKAKLTNLVTLRLRLNQLNPTSQR